MFLDADCMEVIESCRLIFEKTFFSDIIDISDAEMNRIVLSIYNELNSLPNDGVLDFSEMPQFFVMRLYADRVTHLVSTKSFNIYIFFSQIVF